MMYNSYGVHLCCFPSGKFKLRVPLSLGIFVSLCCGVWWGGVGLGGYFWTALLLLVFVNKTLHGNGK